MSENTVRRDTVDLLKLVKYGIEKCTNPMPLLDQLIEELPRAHKAALTQSRLAAIDECIAVCGEYCCGDKNLEKMLTELEALKEKPE